jgi:hypothetical protein
MPTLAQYRQAIATDLGSFASGAATAGSTTNALEIASFPFKSARAIDTLYEDWYILRPAAAAADRVRSVKTYAPTTGTFYPDLAWADAPTVGEAIELHGLIEPNVEMNSLVNAALRRCFLVAEFSFNPASASDVRHSLATAAPWLDDDRLIRSVGYLAAGEDRDEIDPYSRSVRGVSETVNGTPYLNIGCYTTTTTIYVLTLKPAYAHCRASGGAYGSQSGLALDTDEAPTVASWVSAGAQVEAWQRFGHLLDASAGNRQIRDQAQAAILFTQERIRNLQVPDRTLRRVYAWGPR